MKSLILPSVLMLASSVSWSKAPPQNHKALTSLMQEVRDPYFDSIKRQKYLQFTQTHMQTMMGKELGVAPAKLSGAFLQNQNHMAKLWEPNWIALQTEFYATLHQEVLHQRWTARTKTKKVTDYGKNIAQAMVLHLGKYSGVKEGHLYGRWNNLEVNKNGKTVNHRIPSFIFAPDTQGLISLDPHTGYQALMPKDAEETMSNPSLNTMKKRSGLKSVDDLQEIAELVQLNHRIYIRAVANSAKTVASVHYLTGEYNISQAEGKVSNFVEEYCEGCSSKEKKDYKAAAISYVKNTRSEFSQIYTAKSIVSTFCSDLKQNGYTFEDKYEFENKPPVNDNIRIRQQIPAAVIDNTRVDMSHVLAAVKMGRLSAIRKTVAEHDLGVLFLTHALSRLENNNVSATWLGCTKDSEERDSKRIKLAISEASGKVEEYIKLINTKIRNSTFSVRAATETLEYFSQTNVSATAEAVMTFPQGISLVVESVYNLDRDVKRRKRVDTAVAWGGTVIGVALAVTGIGAPEGAAVLIAVAAMTKGAVWGSYYMYRSHQEKAFYKELSSAKAGLGNNFYLDGHITDHYRDYRDMRISYITEFAQAAIQFAKIHKMAVVRTEGNVPKAHGLIKKTLQKAKVIGEEVGQDQIAQMIVSAAF